MDALSKLDPMTVIILASVVLVIGFVLFAKFIKGLLKIAIIAVMLVCILYFLRQAGIV